MYLLCVATKKPALSELAILEAYNTRGNLQSKVLPK